ncbi:hypothetical protein ACCD10_31985 [Pseudomonas sp. Pseusp122]|uniref:hypothetical protein n=1 Tax=unclassified Pseudomonas TaxID=196821 RepID=UPI0039A69D7D
MDHPTLYPGQLDPDFSQWPEAPGWVDLLRALNWSPVMDLFFSSVAPTEDGKLYACGYFAQTTDATVEYFITRLHDDARLDTGFGDQGIVRGTFPVNFKAIMPTRLTLQDDGKLLMQAQAYSNMQGEPDPLSFVLRLLENGQPDPDFADQGLLRLDMPVGRYNQLAAGFGQLRVLSDGRIQGCHSGINHLTFPSPKASAALYRLKTNGQLDDSFNGNGLVDLGVTGASLHVTDFVIDLDHTTVVVGHISYPGEPWHKGVVARLDVQGQLDRAFGDQGTGFQELSLFDQHLHLHTIDVRPDGSLIVAGRAREALDTPDNVDGRGVIIGLTTKGLMDPYFNGGKPLFTPINDHYNVEWRGIRSLKDGRLLVAGRSRQRGASFDTYLYLARYLVDGRPDPGFGNDGTGRIETHTGGNNEPPFEMALQRDGKVLIGLNAGGMRKGTLLRYLP